MNISPRLVDAIKCNLQNNEAKIRDRLITQLNDRIPLDKIYGGRGGQFGVSTLFLQFMNEIVLPVYGYDQMVSYFIDYYSYKFAADSEDAPFNREYIFKGLSAINDKAKASATDILFVRAAIEAWNKSHEKYLCLPEYVYKAVDQCFKANTPIIIEYPKKIEHHLSRKTFIEQCLLNQYSRKDLAGYIRNISAKSGMDNGNYGSRSITQYILAGKIDKRYGHRLQAFILEVMQDITYKREFTNDLAELCETGKATPAIKKYFNQIRWKDYTAYAEQWKQYTEAEVLAELTRASNIFLHDRDKFSKHRILEKLYGLTFMQSNQYTEMFFDLTPSSKYINKIIGQFYQSEPEQLIAQNLQSLTIGSQEWKLFVKYRNSIKQTTIDFNQIPLEIRKDIQKCMIRHYKLDSTTHRTFAFMAREIAEICVKYKPRSIIDITNETVLLHIQNCRRANISPNTLRSYIYKIRCLFDWINTLPRYKNDPIPNPAEHIHIRNAHKNTIHTVTIPPEVRVQLDVYSSELDSPYRVLLHLLTETGNRFGDQINSEVDDVVLSEDKKNGLFYFNSDKTRDRRISEDVYEETYMQITLDLYNELQEYIQETDLLRKKFGTNKIFVNENVKGQQCALSSATYINKINALAKKHGIHTVDGKLWHYTAKQSRKTAASDIISNNGSLLHVQSLLRHLSPNTTEIYYAEVNNEMVMQKNTKFFQQKFILFASTETLSRYTEDERRSLYVDYLCNYREVELGMCCKNISEGSCASYGQYLCATCPKLITGEKYRSKWKALYDDSKNRVDELHKIYQKNGILQEEYNEYREYTQEVDLMMSYKAVLDAIDELKVTENHEQC